MLEQLHISIINFTDDFFMAELAYTIRVLFLNDLTEYAA